MYKFVFTYEENEPHKGEVVCPVSQVVVRWWTWNSNLDSCYSKVHVPFTSTASQMARKKYLTNFIYGSYSVNMYSFEVYLKKEKEMEKWDGKMRNIYIIYKFINKGPGKLGKSTKKLEKPNVHCKGEEKQKQLDGESTWKAYKVTSCYGVRHGKILK